MFLTKSKESGDDSQGYKVNPGKVLVFSSSSPNSKHQVSDLTISNTGEMYLSVKVRTTNPTMFLVSPHTACLAPGQKISIRSVKYRMIVGLYSITYVTGFKQTRVLTKCLNNNSSLHSFRQTPCYQLNS